jgi:hypothetical protein
LKDTLNDHITSLIESHYNNLMSDAGLLTTHQTITAHTLNPTEPLSHIPQTSPGTLAETLQNFSTWLSSPHVLDPPRLLPLTAHGHRGKVHHEALKRLSNAYELICEEIRKPANRYEAGMTLLGTERPFGKVAVLNQILGIEEDI